MKVTAFIGSARKQHTYHAAEQLLHQLQSPGHIEYEIVPLSEYRVETCHGCKLCFDKGEEYCPFHDDRDPLIAKMIASDGVIFASPNYAFHVSALMKIFLDRLAFMLHRPRFFGKTFTSLVAQGIYGGKDIVKYFNFIGNGLGFNVVNGCCITTLEPMTEKDRKKIETILDRQSQRFSAQFVQKAYPTPSLLQLMVFRMSRSSMKIMLNEHFRDYAYYLNNGWFESDYYYPVQLNPFKKLTGRFFDMLATHLARHN